MPKISYLDYVDDGSDFTEVTPEQIEQKIADIEMLLRGMIDEDNILSTDDGSAPVPLAPSNVIDMPTETRPVQNSMKFFGVTREHSVSIKEKLFDELFNLMDERPNLTMVNGIGDKEIILEFVPDDDNPKLKDHKAMEIEVPFFYVPMTYRDLWPIIKKLKVPMLKFDMSGGADNPVIWEDTIETIEEFESQLARDGLDSIATERYINVSDNTGSVDASNVSFSSKDNRLDFYLNAEIDDKKKGAYYRYTVSVLCRVNP
jgi:hypothetical protein